MRLHPSVRAGVEAVLAAAVFGFVVTSPLCAAPDTEIRPTAPPKKKIDEIMVPIPGWSPEVASNGCHVRQSSDELSPDRRPGVPELPFWALIEHAVRRQICLASRDELPCLRSVGVVDRVSIEIEYVPHAAILSARAPLIVSAQIPRYPRSSALPAFTALARASEVNRVQSFVDVTR